MHAFVILPKDESHQNIIGISYSIPSGITLALMDLDIVSVFSWEHNEIVLALVLWNSERLYEQVVVALGRTHQQTLIRWI
jgi:hypothetical protein